MQFGAVNGIWQMVVVMIKFDFTEWDIWSYTTIPFMWNLLSSYSEDAGGIFRGSWITIVFFGQKRVFRLGFLHNKLEQAQTLWN